MMRERPVRVIPVATAVIQQQTVNMAWLDTRFLANDAYALLFWPIRRIVVHGFSLLKRFARQNNRVDRVSGRTPS